MVRFLTPRWLALHVGVLLACVGTVFAARWQWDVANRTHAMRNYAYTVQWIFFLGFGVWFWLKIIRDARGQDAGASTIALSAGIAPADAISSRPSYRGYAMPQSAAITVEDPELVRYNEYLAALSGADPTSAPAVSDVAAPVVRTEGRP